MAKNNVELSICVVSWNCCAKLRECLQSIFLHSQGLIIEVIVVDNASSDNTIQMVMDEYPQVRLIRNKTNIGFGRGNNIAIEKCRGKYILLLNPDIVIKKACFKELISSIETLPEAGVVGCRLVNKDGSIQKSFYKSFPSIMSELYWGLMLHRIKNIMPRYKGDKNQAIKVSWLVGGCMLLRKGVLSQMNGFNIKYFMYGEDVDLCYRLKKMNLKAYYLPNITMLHYHGVSSKKQKRHYFSAVMQRESVYKFMLINYGRFTAFLYRCVWIVCGSVRVALCGIGCIAAHLMFKEKSKEVVRCFEKYMRVLSWGLGFEKWTKRQGI